MYKGQSSNLSCCHGCRSGCTPHSYVGISQIIEFDCLDIQDLEFSALVKNGTPILFLVGVLCPLLVQPVVSPCLQVQGLNVQNSL